MNEINAAGGKAIGISTDCTDGKSVKNAFEQLKKEMGDASLAAAIYNVGGKFVRKPFLELSEEEFESGWEANGFVLTESHSRKASLSEFQLTSLVPDAVPSTSPRPPSHCFSRELMPLQSSPLL